MEGLTTKGSSFTGFPASVQVLLSPACQGPGKHSKQGDRKAMIRVRTIAAQCAREFARSAPIARGVGDSRGSHVVVRALTDSSQRVPAAAAPQEPTKQFQRVHVVAPDSETLEPQHTGAVVQDKLKDDGKNHAGKGKRPKQWDVS